MSFTRARGSDVRWLAETLGFDLEMARDLLEDDKLNPSFRANHVREAAKGMGLDKAAISQLFAKIVTIREELLFEDVEKLHAIRQRRARALRPDPPDPGPLMLASHGGDRRSERARDQSSDRTLKRGDNEEYWLARLRRDRPDLVANVVAGELSAREAATKAGLRKPTRPSAESTGSANADSGEISAV